MFSMLYATDAVMVWRFARLWKTLFCGLSKGVVLEGSGVLHSHFLSHTRGEIKVTQHCTGLTKCDG